GRGGVDGRHFWLNIETDQPVVQHCRREVEAHAIFLVVHRDLVVFFRHRYREFAAGKEARRLAGSRDQVGLGQAAGNAAVFQRLERDVNGKVPGKQSANQRRSRRRGGGGRVGIERDAARAGDVACGDFGAELLANLAVDLDEADVELNLLRRGDVDRIDDLLLAGEFRRDLGRLFSSKRIVRRAGQYQPAVCRLHFDIGARNRVADRARQPVSVERYLDIDAADQLLVLVEQRDAGRAEVIAQHIEGTVRERIDIGDLGIADDDLVERHVGFDRLWL